MPPARRVVVVFDRAHSRMILNADSATERWLRTPAPQSLLMNISRLVEGRRVRSDPHLGESSCQADIETPTTIAAMLTAEFDKVFPDERLVFVSATRRAP